jgi:hypothetical protein
MGTFNVKIDEVMSDGVSRRLLNKFCSAPLIDDACASFGTVSTVSEGEHVCALLCNPLVGVVYVVHTIG